MAKKPVSRQRGLQKQYIAEGNCMICRQPRKGASAVYCLFHLEDHRRRERARTGYKNWEKGKRGRPPKNAIAMDVPAVVDSETPKT